MPVTLDAADGQQVPQMADAYGAVNVTHKMTNKKVVKSGGPHLAKRVNDTIRFLRAKIHALVSLQKFGIVPTLVMDPLGSH